MKIVDAGFNLIDIDDPVKKIERVARVCYKSEDKITESSAEKMVKALIKSNHTAMLEHSSLVVAVDSIDFYRIETYMDYLERKTGFNCYLRHSYINRPIVSGNIRAWREFLIACQENNLCISYSLADIFKSEKYKVFFEDIDNWVYRHTTAREINPCDLSPEEQLIHRDFTVLFTVDRGVSHEIVRHRVASFAQESTRYCNYGNKGGEITVIEPCYLKVDGVDVSVDNWSERYGAWRYSCEEAEKSYIRMLADGATPQEARAVLPKSLKTELVMTANLKEWRHFFKLRAVGVTGKPHPQMLEVAVPLLAECKKLIPIVFDDLEVKEC